MQRASNWVAWGAVAVVVGLAILNWQTLMSPAPIDLWVMRIEAPLGILMLCLTAVVVALFLLATLRNQIGSLLETRKLLKEIQRVQALADQSEASRIESLHQFVAAEFRRINDRLASLPEPPLIPAVLKPRTPSLHEEAGKP
ncbi:MAG: hypothetical protein ABIR52_05385 [Casimicrobiaceae bacterium]